MIIVLYLGSLITEMFSVIYFVYRCDSSMLKFGHVCVRLAYRTQQTIQSRTTKQNKANLPKRKPTISLLLKYSLILPNAKEKDKDKKKNIYK